MVRLRELVMDGGQLEGETVILPHTKERLSSPVCWRLGYTSLTPVPEQHAWFMDGIAKYIGQERHWKTIAYNPHT